MGQGGAGEGNHLEKVVIGKVYIEKSLHIYYLSRLKGGFCCYDIETPPPPPLYIEHNGHAPHI